MASGTIQVGIWYRTINVLDLSAASYENIDHRFRTNCESQKPRNHSLKGAYLSYYNNREKPRGYECELSIHVARNEGDPTIPN